MKSYEMLNKLADKFEKKLAKYGQDSVTVSQSGTTELFFGDEAKQLAFVKALGELTVQGDKVVGTGPVAQVLANYRNKTEQAAKFSMDVSAESGKGAAININVEPASLKPSITAALDSLFQKFTGKKMSQVLALADQKAKQGSGSGTNHVQDLDVA